MSSETFRVGFSEEGLVKLGEEVKEKLREFMGDYMDDTLVEYIIVLVRNGRRKEEAEKELHLFLNDDSIPFVSWLWDHLSANLELYTQPSRTSSGNSAKKSASLESTKHTMQPDMDASFKPGNGYDGENVSKLSRRRRDKEWKGLLQDEPGPLLRSKVVDGSESLIKSQGRRSPIRRSSSPKSQIHRKRSRQDEHPASKKEVAPRPMLGASCRLLQFAVRDAVRTIQPPVSKSQPSPKRLRSVVSSSSTDQCMLDKPRRTMSVVQETGPVATAIRAAAEAAEDAKIKRSGNIFGRLSRGSDMSEVISVPSNHRASSRNEDDDFLPPSKHSNYNQTGFDEESKGDAASALRNSDVASNSRSDFGGFGSGGSLRRRVGQELQSASSTSKERKPLNVQYSISQTVCDTTLEVGSAKGHAPSTISTPNASNKILNISVNVNTWKSPDYQVSKETTEPIDEMDIDKITDSKKLPAQLPRKNGTVVAGDKNEAVPSDDSQELKNSTPTPGSYTGGRPSDDADSRTVFVNNVHFAATKDAISRHFNKFGEVLKVVIMTDASTGHSIGSAYIEFLRKESAEMALSLSGTSFMSRILKVGRRSSGSPDGSSVSPWPHVARAASFAPRLGRVPYPRVLMGSPFRARAAIKPGARSLQWRRDAPAVPSPDGTKNLQNPHASGNGVASTTGRNLTYIRSEAKPNGGT